MILMLILMCCCWLNALLNKLFFSKKLARMSVVIFFIILFFLSYKMDSVPRIPHAYEMDPVVTDPLNYFRSIIRDKLNDMIGKGFTDTVIQMPMPSCFFNDSNLKDEDERSLKKIYFEIKDELEYLGYDDIQGGYDDPDQFVKPLWMVISFHWKNVSVPHPIIKGSN